MRARRILHGVALSVGVVCLTAWGQQAGPQRAPTGNDAREQTLRRYVDMVIVPVTAVDPFGRLVTGLEKSDFRVLENGVQQEVLLLSQEETPISAGVVFDRSGSMSGLMDGARRAAMHFFKAANPEDEFFLVVFGSRVQQHSEFTSRAEELSWRVFETSAGGKTALNDALYVAVNKMRQARHSRRVLVVVSDGLENNSRYSDRDVERAAREADTQWYSFGSSWGLVQKLVEQSGGRAFGLYSWDDTLSHIWQELRSQYVLAYRSSHRTRDGRWRKIKVEVRQPRGMPPVKVYAKLGYYAPSL